MKAAIAPWLAAALIGCAVAPSPTPAPLPAHARHNDPVGPWFDRTIRARTAVPDWRRSADADGCRPLRPCLPGHGPAF